MLESIVDKRTQEERLDTLKAHTLKDNPDLLREFYNHPDAFKASFKYDVSNKTPQDIKNFVLDNYFEIHAVAKDIAQEGSAFKALPLDLVSNHIATLMATDDIDLNPTQLVGQDADYECKE